MALAGSICSKHTQFSIPLWKSFGNWHISTSIGNTRRISFNKRLPPRWTGQSTHRNLALTFALGIPASCLFYYGFRQFYDDFTKFYQSKVILAAAKKSKKDANVRQTLTSRELRFMHFASVEFDGQIFMTPRDFLDSVIHEAPRARDSRRLLTPKEVKKMLKRTPLLNKDTTKLFQEAGDNGLISYTEYLFLLCVVTKPSTGFRIAFNMFDTDGNQRVDKREFLVIQALTLVNRADGRITDLDPDQYARIRRLLLTLVKSTSIRLSNRLREQMESVPSLMQLEDVFARSRRRKREQDTSQVPTNEESSKAQSESEPCSAATADSLSKAVAQEYPEESPVESSQTHDTYDSIWDRSQQMDPERVQDTTLLRHFFGQKGDKTLTYDDFFVFTENLQTEVLEHEFLEYSNGRPVVTETEFAKMLLRYTVVRPETYKKYMERVKERIPDATGISFANFRQFCQFLSNLDDFTIAVKLYTFADLPVSQPEFSRAVKVSTGYALDAHVIDTVFQIFDVNNDGRLSYAEFIAVMRDRQNRGFKSHLLQQNGWESFKRCVRAEMKRY